MAQNDRPGSPDSPDATQDLDAGRATAQPIGSRQPDGPGAHPDGSEPGRSSAAMRGTQGADRGDEPRAANSEPRSMPSQAHRADSGPGAAESAAAADTDETPQAEDRLGARDIEDPASR